MLADLRDALTRQTDDDIQAAIAIAVERCVIKTAGTPAVN